MPGKLVLQHEFFYYRTILRYGLLPCLKKYIQLTFIIFLQHGPWGLIQNRPSDDLMKIASSKIVYLTQKDEFESEFDEIWMKQTFALMHVRCTFRGEGVKN